MKQPSKFTIGRSVGLTVGLDCLIQLGFQTNSASPKRCFAKDGGLFQDHRSTSHLRRAADGFFFHDVRGGGWEATAMRYFFRGIEGEELAILAQKIRVSFTACVYPCLYPSLQNQLSFAYNGICQMSSGTPEVRLKK